MSGPIRVAVLTISDRRSRGEAEDVSGPALAAVCRDGLQATIIETGLVADETTEIADTLRDWAAETRQIDLILTTGGTGLGPRDVTPEAAMSVFQRPHPALMELARARCLAKTPRCYLSRGVAGVINRTLVVTLPGSVRGATETLEALLDVLPHAVQMVRGNTGHDQ